MSDFTWRLLTLARLAQVVEERSQPFLLDVVDRVLDLVPHARVAHDVGGDPDHRLAHALEAGVVEPSREREDLRKRRSSGIRIPRISLIALADSRARARLRFVIRWTCGIRHVYCMVNQ
jgi:hypothetical protein